MSWEINSWTVAGEKMITDEVEEICIFMLIIAT